MSRETEKLMKQLNKFLDENLGEDDTEDDLNALASQFMAQHNANIAAGNYSNEPESADDYLDLARSAPSRKKRLEYVNKALELEPDNLDAGLAKASLTAKSPHELLETLNTLLQQGEEQLKKEGFFESDCIGEFWGMLETRPYMRVRQQYIDTLVSLGMMRKAADECERTLELCESDNLGIRYELMHLYAYLEDEASALTLHQKFNEYEETQLLLPLVVLYYKLGDSEKSINFLKLLTNMNKDTKKFIGAAKRQNYKKYYAEMSPYGYRPNTMDEFLEEMRNYGFLFDSVPCFFEWAEKNLQKKK